MEIVREAVRDALDAVRSLETEVRKGIVTHKDIKVFFGGNLEGKFVDAFRILEAEASGEN